MLLYCRKMHNNSKSSTRLQCIGVTTRIKLNFKPVANPGAPWVVSLLTPAWLLTSKKIYIRHCFWCIIRSNTKRRRFLVLSNMHYVRAVSYTHLTLPTIYSV